MALRQLLRASNSARFVCTSVKSLAAPTGLTPNEVIKKSEELYQANLKMATESSDSFSIYAKSRTKLWEEKYDIYYGKDRDTVNFPMVTIPEHHPKLRLGILPEPWFQAFYKKTGVTGPYLFFWGGLTFLLSKEYLVMDHDFFEAVTATIALVWLHKKFGPKITDYLEKQRQEKTYNAIYAPVEALKKDATEVLNGTKSLIANQGIDKHLFEAKREIVDFQLESEYRQRILDLHKAVKARLDYQVQKEVVRKSFQRQHMIDWITNNVESSITPQLEKETITQCIKELQTLAAKQHAHA